MTKKSIIALLLILSFQVNAQNDSLDKNSYKILKLDFLNLVGLTVQKANIGYEFSPLPSNLRNLPTVQVNLEVPFNSLQNNFNVKIGLESSVNLRFYPQKRYRDKTAEGYYWGAGIQGGWINYSEDVEYRLNSNWSVIQWKEHNYNRVRTSVYAIFGTQASLGSKLYFDMNIGLGWSNVNVVKDAVDIDPSYNEWGSGFYGPFLIQFDEGKYQTIYMPITMSIGYNFGSR